MPYEPRSEKQDHPRLSVLLFLAVLGFTVLSEIIDLPLVSLSVGLSGSAAALWGVRDASPDDDREHLDAEGNWEYKPWLLQMSFWGRILFLNWIWLGGFSAVRVGEIIIEAIRG